MTEENRPTDPDTARSHALTKDTPEVRSEICTRIAGGETLHAILKNSPHLPDYSRVISWIHDPNDRHRAFRKEFERAQMAYTQHWLDAAEERLLDHEIGWMWSEKKKTWIPDNYAISHLREIMAHARWRAKALLDQFGDKIRVETEERESENQPRIDWTKLSDSALKEVQAAIYYPNENNEDPRVVGEGSTDQ